MAEITLPPFPTSVLIFGALLTVLALSGQITIREARVGISDARLRFVAGLIGAVLIGISVWLFFTPALTSPPALSANSAAAPAGTPLAQPRNIPIERYRDLSGKWMVIENVRPEHGGYEITWNYEATVLGSLLTMQGKKTLIDGHKPTVSEKATVSVYTLTLGGLEVEGTSDERNANGAILRSTLKIHFAENLMSFSGTLQSGGADISTLNGNKQ